MTGLKSLLEWTFSGVSKSLSEGVGDLLKVPSKEGSSQYPTIEESLGWDF